MKIAITGGHLSPALSVIEKLSKEDVVLFVGRKHVFEGDKGLSFEYKTITSLNIPFVELTTGRLQRKFTAHTLFSIVKIPYGLAQSFLILRKFKPDVVLGFGGYLSVPVVIAAHILRIPAIIHEQTQDAGLANRMLANYADRICISWETSAKYFPRGKTIFTGNPIRKLTPVPRSQD